MSDQVGGILSTNTTCVHGVPITAGATCGDCVKWAESIAHPQSTNTTLREQIAAALRAHRDDPDIWHTYEQVADAVVALVVEAAAQAIEELSGERNDCGWHDNATLVTAVAAVRALGGTE